MLNKLLLMTVLFVSLSFSQLIVIHEYEGFATGRVPASSLKYNEMTHLYIFGYHFNASYGANSGYTSLWSGSADDKTFAPLMNTFRDSCNKYGVKRIIGVVAANGADITSFLNVINHDTTAGGWQDLAIQQIIRYKNLYGLQGIDFNIEVPTNSNQGRMYLERFIRTLRQNWTDAYISLTLETFDLFNWNDQASTQITVNTQNYLDYIVLMKYGMEDNGKLRFDSPLKAPYAGYTPDNGSGIQTWSNQHSGELWWAKLGFKKSKFVMLLGVGESKYFTYTGADTIGSTATKVGQGFADFQDVVITAGTVNPMMSPFYHWNAAAAQGYIATNGKFYVFQDSLSIAMRIKWCIDNGLGGVGGWGLYRSYLYNNPSNRFPQVDWMWATAKQYVGGVVIPPIVPPPPVVPPVAICYTQTQLDSAKKTVTCPDTTVFFNHGMLYYKSLIPNTITVTVPKP